jgi:ATP phosphoribosyltransferase regulatory subunit
MTGSRAETERLARLITGLADAGYARADVPLLHPAAPFLDLSGEDIRRRLFITQDAEGRELCLRPEFTIPLCLDYIAGPELGLEKRMAYLGTVFRHRAAEPGEFRQAGIEAFGREDRPAADAEIAGLAMEAAETLGRTDLLLRMGDIAVLDRAIAGIGLPAAEARRLKLGLASGRPPAVTGKGEATGLGGYGGVLKALSGAEPKAARAFVEDLLRMAGVEANGGRSAAEIADRFLARAADGGTGGSAEQATMVGKLVSISGDPDNVANALRDFAADTGIDMSEVLDAFEARTGFMAARGLDIGKIVASPGFARSLDYYTGMVFELTDPARPDVRPLVGGGRYDRLLRRLGAPDDIAAVGFSVWIERVQAQGANA